MHKRTSLPLFPGIALLLLINTALSAQDSTRYLTLSEAISTTLANNKAIRLAQMDEQIAQSNYRQTDAIYLPQVGLSYTAFNTNNPLNAFGFKLQQQSIASSDFNPSLLNKPGSTSDFTTKLDIQQPLLNLDQLYKRKAANAQTDIYRFQSQRTREQMTFEVTKAYLQLQLAYQAVAVLQDALKTSQSVLQFIDNRFQQGFLQKSDLLNAQVQVSSVKTQLAQASSNILNASDYLGLLMGVGEGIRFKVDPAADDLIVLNDSISRISNSRSDFQAIQKSMEATDLQIKSSRMSRLPRINAFGSYQLNDAQMLGFGADAYIVGLQLTWDIFNGNRTKHTISTQRLERQKLDRQLEIRKEQEQLSLSKTRRDLDDANFLVTQQQASVAQATESLQILQNRLQQGLVNTTDVLQAATQLSQQRFALAQAIFSEQVTRAYIQLLTTSSTSINQ